jgi:hypothetical protein
MNMNYDGVKLKVLLYLNKHRDIKIWVRVEVRLPFVLTVDTSGIRRTGGRLVPRDGLYAVAKRTIRACAVLVRPKCALLKRNKFEDIDRYTWSSPDIHIQIHRVLTN